MAGGDRQRAAGGRQRAELRIMVRDVEVVRAEVNAAVVLTEPVMFAMVCGVCGKRFKGSVLSEVCPSCYF